MNCLTRILEIKLAVDEFIPFLTKVLEESGEDAMKLVGSLQSIPGIHPD